MERSEHGHCDLGRLESHVGIGREDVERWAAFEQQDGKPEACEALEPRDLSFVELKARRFPPRSCARMRCFSNLPTGQRPEI